MERKNVAGKRVRSECADLRRLVRANEGKDDETELVGCTGGDVDRRVAGRDRDGTGNRAEPRI